MIFENQDIGGHRRTRKDIKGHEKTPSRKNFETMLKNIVGCSKLTTVVAGLFRINAVGS